MTSQQITEFRRNSAENFIDDLLRDVPAVVCKKLREKAIGLMLRPIEGLDENSARAWLAEKLFEYDDLPGCKGLSRIAKLIAPRADEYSPLAAA